MRETNRVSRLLILLAALVALMSNTVPQLTLNGEVCAAARYTNASRYMETVQTASAGRKIVFASDRDGTAAIYTMDLDGSNLTRLASNTRIHANPAWSPDGSKIAFVIYGAGGSWPNLRGEIYVMDADGGNQIRLTTSRNDNFPAWAPDGTKIAFSQEFSASGEIGIFVMNSDGTDQKRITAFGQQPAWSPDGSKLAFTNGLNIYSVNSDGSDIVQFTKQPTTSLVSDWDFAPAWSPDGTRIAFTRFVNCNGLDETCQAAEIWTANADGSGGRLLRGFPLSLTYVDDPAPSWSPDGSTIFFSVSGELFATSEDGSALTNLTNTSAITESHPSLPLLSLSCVDSVSATRQSIEATGGAGTIDVAARSDCSWTASSTADWITTTHGGGTGSGSLTYTVAPHTGSGPRSGSLIVAGHLVIVTQLGVPPTINSAIVDGKRLIVVGERFDPGAVILLNGVEQKTKNPNNPGTMLIGKKIGKKVRPGGSLKVRNPNGSVSAEFIFTGT